ncbi:MAG TPA: alpha/beta hydrolase-fold protein [Blastocatellia bacterium]|nr:alpha/beta hydrolase-fold protein [Blastocatellia bacterium]
MYKAFMHYRRVGRLAFCATCLMSLCCTVRQPGLPSGLIAQSAKLLRESPGSQEPATELVAGTKVERVLAPSQNHVYVAQLENGAAVIAEADQDGIDLVIDVYGPDGQRITRLDSASGMRGSETIDFTALRSGVYKFVVRAEDNGAKAGKYVMNTNQILGPAAKARRLAKELYPTRALYDLWEAALTDPNAVDRFISEHKHDGPIIEQIPGNALEMRVTYFCVGDPDTESAELVGGPDFNGLKMSRLGKTNLFFVTQVVPADARFVYAFNLYKVHRAGPKGEVEVAESVHSDDSILEMPNAGPQPYIAVKDGVSKGNTVQTTIQSALLEEERTITVYTPAGYDSKTGCNLLIVFDGVTYGGLPDRAEVPSPTILDNLIAEKKIGPTVAVLVWSMGKRNRDLPGSKPFADFIAGELVPWARSHFSILRGPKSVVAAGSSLGGFCATYCAFTHPDVIGNVISQSGSYWVSRSWQTVGAEFHRRLYPRDTGTMIEEFKASKRLPIRFYMEIGIYDLGAAMLGSNRELRDVLQLKGYDVDYREFAGGHNSQNWRGSLADGLISLLGRKQN